MNIYGLIGYPLEHSFSKRYFTEKFLKENIPDSAFELFSLESISQFPQLVSRSKNIRGLAVTIPYKQAIIPYLSYLDDNAREIGAVNCVQFSKNNLIGYNTDSIGFERSFVPLLNSGHTKALVLGNGGASKAVQFVLRKLGMPFLIVTRQEITDPGYIHYDNIDIGIMASYPVIINCTPLGMAPNESGLPPIPYQYLDEKNLLYDLIYSPEQTEFLSRGLQKGATIKNGFEMLILQAEENWRIWHE